MSLQCSVPLLLTARAQRSYVYAADPRVLVPRVAAEREIAAVRRLRAGAAREWRRSEKGFTAWREDIWAQNQRVVQGMLNDQ